jgi:hypothetical protein
MTLNLAADELAIGRLVTELAGRLPRDGWRHPCPLAVQGGPWSFRLCENGFRYWGIVA